jgi:hypothetical protein
VRQVFHEDEGNGHGKGGDDDPQSDGEGSEPVAPGEGRASGRFRQLGELFADRIVFRGIERIGHDRWKRVGNDLMSRLWSRRLPKGAPQADRPASFAKAAHEVEQGVDNAPGDIATDGGDEHCPHILAPCFGHAEGTGEGKDHDQAEEDLGNAVVGFEYALGCFHGRSGQEQTASAVAVETIAL